MAKEGFDPSALSDPLYILDQAGGAYLPLTPARYTVPSWPGTFASESLHTSVPEGGTLWGGVIAGVSAAVRDLFYTRFVIFIL